MANPRRDATRKPVGPAQKPEPKGGSRSAHLGTRPRGATAFRIPIAVKFAGFTGILIVVFMSWQMYVAARSAALGLEEEINRTGIALATTFSTALDLRGKLDGTTLQAALRALLDELRKGPEAEWVLNVVVWSGGAPIATAREETQFRRSEGKVLGSRDAEAAGVEIREFTYEGIPVRSFAKAAARLAQEPAGDSTRIDRVEVFLAASAIEESRSRMANAMLSTGATAGVLAVLGAALLARLLTAPIRALGRDMKQVSLGDLDHKSQVRSRDEIGELARTFNLMTEGLKAAEQAKIARRAAEQELELASRIQAKLLPADVPRVEGYELAVRYSPAKEVSGDYYDFFELDGGKLGAVVADVSGKGVPAALVMTMTRSLLRIAAHQEASPERTLELLHRSLVPDLERGMFVTMVYFVLSPAAHEVSLVRAGHNAPLLYVAREKRVVRVQPRGLGIGLDRGGALFRAELRAQRIALERGDVLLAYTDGLVEGKDREGKDYGEARLIGAFQASAEGPAAELIDRLASDLSLHQRGREPSDDVTIVALKRTA